MHSTSGEEHQRREQETRPGHVRGPDTRTTELADPKSSSAARGAAGSTVTSPSTTNAYTWRPGGRRSDTAHFPVSESRWSGVATGFQPLKLPTSATREAFGADSSKRTTSRAAPRAASDTAVVGAPALGDTLDCAMSAGG